MAAATIIYDNAAKHLDDDVDWVSDTITVTLHSSVYVPQTSHEFFNQATNELPTGVGYTNGGQNLASKSRVVSGRTTSYLAATTSWTVPTANTLTARYAVIRKNTGTPSTSPLLGYVLMDTTPNDVNATGAAFTLTWDSSNGVLQITAS